jgi:hypothetical protein
MPEVAIEFGGGRIVICRPGCWRLVTAEDGCWTVEQPGEEPISGARAAVICLRPTRAPARECYVCPYLTSVTRGCQS